MCNAKANKISKLKQGYVPGREYLGKYLDKREACPLKTFQTKTKHIWVQIILMKYIWWDINSVEH